MMGGGEKALEEVLVDVILGEKGISPTGRLGILKRRLCRSSSSVGEVGSSISMQ